MLSLPGLPWPTRALILSLATLAAAALPAAAAEEVVLDFGPFSRTLPVPSLQKFAATGELDEPLSTFLRRLSPEQRETFRVALTANRAVDLIPVSQWFYDSMGEQTLLFVGQFTQTSARLNGQRALRAAIIQAVAEDQDISLLEVIERFPTEAMRLDLVQVLQRANQVIQEVEVTQKVVAVIKQQSLADAAQPPPLDLAALPDLTQPGPYGSRQISLVLQDRARNRIYPAELVVPQNLAAVPGPIPVVVLSHGLGDSPASFLDIAAHVASHGFVVALPEHIGSNFTLQQAMLTGLSRESFKAEEFLDRPLDVSFLLDELARMNTSTFDGRLNLDAVTVVGHSLGGYTALAVGGGTIDFERLAQRCNPTANIVADAALVLECRALDLLDNPPAVQRLGQEGVEDPRVKLVMAFTPVSNLFGPSGIRRLQLPVMIFGGEFDILAPVVPQQVAAFSWLTGPERYLYLAENTSHSPNFTRLINNLLSMDEYFEQSIEEALVMTRGVNKSLIVAFSQVYGAGRLEYSPFLTAAYVEAISTNDRPLHLVRTLPPQLEPLLESPSF
ncbi:MAG TPA: alpha/beta hydrolase [Leptolyngbyaceae cyanobacterium M65_K2018_010]|nr:alpha/beta hydrolase [Leptolyngbyaceae cyanobacterium M65_K2018_010]